MVENAPVPKMLRLWLAGAILVVGILFVFVVYQAARMSELSDVRAMDIAQLARNIAHGRGFTTEFIRPLSLAQVPRVTNHPDLVHAPVYPAFMALMFKIFGESTRTISWSSGIPFLLSIPLVYWLGLRTFSRKVGMLSALVLATNAVALTVAVSGTEGALLGLLFTLLCVVLVYHQSHSSLRLPLAAAAGALTAVLYLTHFVWIVAFAPILLVIIINAGAKQRLPNIVVFTALFIVVVAPWFYRMYNVTGNPLANLSAYEAITNTRTYTGNIVYRSFEENPPGVLAFMFSAPREIYERARNAATELYPLLFSIAGLVITSFFIVGIIVPLGNTGMDRLRLGIYALAILLFWALCLMTPDARLLVPLAPIMTIISVAFFYQLLDLRLRPLTERLKSRWAAIAVVLLVILHIIPLFLQLAPGRPISPALPMAVRRASQELNALVPQISGQEAAPALILTDMPWAVAWYANRPAIWLPRDDVDLRRIEQVVGQVRWLVLTPQVVDIARQERATAWAELWRRAIVRAPGVSEWRVRQIFANGNWVLFERVSDVASVGTLPAAPAP